VSPIIATVISPMRNSPTTIRCCRAARVLTRPSLCWIDDTLASSSSFAAASSYSAWFACVLVLVLVFVSVSVKAESPPLVIGQSLPLGGESFYSATRIVQGAQAYVGYINATGGVNGRRLEVITLDDDGDPDRTERNVRTLVDEHKAVAIINCLGDEACDRAARVVQQLKVPLIGPISGASALRSSSSRFTVALRPSYAVQAEALARQLRAIGLSRVVLLTSSSKSGELRTNIERYLSAIDIRAEIIEIDDAAGASIEAAVARINRGDLQGVVLDVSNATLRRLGELDADHKLAWPPFLATISPGTLTQLTRAIRSRLIGFVNVVPNPDDQRLQIVRDFNAQAEKYARPEAVTFEGMEAYVGIRSAVELARRAGTISGNAMWGVATGLDELDLGGFTIRLNLGQGGPTWVDVGLRSRDGVFIR